MESLGTDFLALQQGRSQELVIGGNYVTQFFGGAKMNKTDIKGQKSINILKKNAFFSQFWEGEWPPGPGPPLASFLLRKGPPRCKLLFSDSLICI